jgi:type VI secretion system protein ImpH
MATTGRATDPAVETSAARATPAPADPASVAQALFEDGWQFDFFQAVRLLNRLFAVKRPVGQGGGPNAEAARFAAELSLGFAPGSVTNVEPPADADAAPTMTVRFLGLTGPNGTLPAHYTKLLFQLEKEAQDKESRALRAWLDLLNHRFVSLFYAAWAKYRFTLDAERAGGSADERDRFARCLFSLIGLGLPALRNRLLQSLDTPSGATKAATARIDDPLLLRYAGLLAHWPRCAVALEQILGDYFAVPAAVRQFLGRWLVLTPENQTRLAAGKAQNNCLGRTAVVGARVWDVQSKLRILLGPLSYRQFVEFLPDRSTANPSQRLFLLAKLVRLYVGLEFDFDVQLVLRAEEIPQASLAAAGSLGSHLGWNAWLGRPLGRAMVNDAVFTVAER